jgi:hypothetical protein
MFIGRCQFGNEIKLLMNYCDAGAFSIPNASESDRSVGQSNFAVIFDLHAGKDFHQCTFAGAVLAHQRMHFAAL